MNIILLGKAGSGKGTQAEMIKNEYDLIHISTGDLIRKEIEENTDLGQKALPYSNEGLLVPDNIIFAILFKNIRNTLKDLKKEDFKGIIFDGFPRTIQQAKLLNKALLRIFKLNINIVMELDLKDELSIARISNRVKESEVARKDDLNIEAIKKRLDIYTRESKKIKDLYSDLPLTTLKVFKADKDKETTFNEIKKFLDSKLNSKAPIKNLDRIEQEMLIINSLDEKTYNKLTEE